MKLLKLNDNVSVNAEMISEVYYAKESVYGWSVIVRMQNGRKQTVSEYSSEEYVRKAKDEFVAKLEYEGFKFFAFNEHTNIRVDAISEVEVNLFSRGGYYVEIFMQNGDKERSKPYDTAEAAQAAKSKMCARIMSASV